MSDFPYPGCFTFVDVEIPNINNNCICAISIIVVENQKEVLRTTELINPRTFFSANNIKIHHIRPKQVTNARTLPQFWQDYGKYFEKPYIIGGHNVMSDISVLNKDLIRTKMKTQIHADHCIDTQDIMENFYYHKKNGKGDLKLCNIAKKLGIEIDHHNPESDVNACYEIVRYMHDNLELDLTPYIKPIRKTKFKSSKNKISPSKIQSYSLQAKRKIANQDPSTKISLQEAKKKGEEAYKSKNLEGTVFYYELLASKNVIIPPIYLRLAGLYEKFSLNKEAIRILEKGIQALKQGNKDWTPLQQMQSRIRQKTTSKKNIKPTLQPQEQETLPIAASMGPPNFEPSQAWAASIPPAQSVKKELVSLDEEPILKSQRIKATRPSKKVSSKTTSSAFGQPKKKEKESRKSILESMRSMFRFGLKK